MSMMVPLSHLPFLYPPPPEVSSPAPPNPAQSTPAFTPASDSSISGTSTSGGPSSGLHQQHVWQGQVNQCLSGANVDIAALCHRRSRSGAVILETVSHLVHASQAMPGP